MGFIYVENFAIAQLSVEKIGEWINNKSLVKKEDPNAQQN
jgi:hypothetical protein